MKLFNTVSSEELKLTVYILVLWIYVKKKQNSQVNK